MGSLRYSTESFEFDVRREPPELTVRLYGALDLATAPFLEIPEHELGALPTLVVDLAELRFCDLAGLQVLHRLCQSQSAAGRRVRMVHARPALLKLAQLSGLVSPCLVGCLGDMTAPSSRTT